MRSTILVLVLAVSLLIIPAAMAEDALEWYTMGQNAATAGNYNLAVTYYDNALAQSPNYAAALAGKAAALNALGKYESALAAADTALTIRASDAVALNARALALFGMKNYNESVVAYDKFFLVQQNQPEAWCNQGYAYLQAGTYEKSVVSYDRCTLMDPLNFMAFNNQGLAYMAMGKNEQALGSFDKATGVTITNATVWNNKGEALVALERPQDALECFKKALGIDPNYEQAQKNRDATTGQAQTFHVVGTITPVTTISRIGTLYTTAVPVTGEVTVPAQTPAEGLTGTPAPAGSTTAVPKRTTYAPISPFTILGALAVAGCAGLCLVRK